MDVFATIKTIDKEELNDMIEYSLNGAWGKTIPDEKLKKALADLGITLEVEARRDGLSNVKISIDSEKILRNKKRTNTKKSKTVEAENADIKTATKKSTSRKTTK